MLVNGRFFLYVVLIYLFLNVLSFLAVSRLLKCGLVFTRRSLFVFCVSAWSKSLFQFGLLNSSISSFPHRTMLRFGGDPLGCAGWELERSHEGGLP
jgi:hypothetical protein